MTTFFAPNLMFFGEFRPNFKIGEGIELKDISISIGIVMISDTNEVVWIRKAVDLGVNDFLQKPVDKAELIHAINNANKSTLQ